MKSKLSVFSHYFINLLFPAVVFGSVTGAFTAAVVCVYKLCAGYVISASQVGYDFLRHQVFCIPIVILAFIGISTLFEIIYKKAPNLKGGGIPSSIAMLRGLVPVKWFLNLIGMFFVSLVSFLIGVPLGNEGPSVQMGTLIGKATVSPFSRKHRVWSRYSMTGGACAGFSVATGAPVSGIIFAVEEAHQSITPMILIVSSTAVIFAHITAELISLLLGIDVRLFHDLKLPELGLGKYWISLAVGVVVGLFAVLFLKYYTLISRLIRKKLRHIAPRFKIFMVFLITLILGLVSSSFISTGHHLIEGLLFESPGWVLLVAILLLRTTATFSANSTGISGGLFLPIMALGATFASLFGKVLISFGLNDNYYTVIVVLGIASCISGMMKTPFTAIVFAIEALSCTGNILPVVIAVATSYIITELFGAIPINDIAMENAVEELNAGKTPQVFDTHVEIMPNSFAVGKQIRDIFWPSNLFVLSVKHGDSSAEVDAHGGKLLRVGDVLHIRYSTYDEPATKEEIVSIVGEQEYPETEDDNI